MIKDKRLTPAKCNAKRSSTIINRKQKKRRIEKITKVVYAAFLQNKERKR